MNKELADIKNRLKTIGRKLQSLSDQQVQLKHQEQKLILRGVELVHGIKVGSVVVSKGIEHRVVAVDHRWGIDDRPWLEGNPRRKDGTFGTARRALYDHWQLKGD